MGTVWGRRLGPVALWLCAGLVPAALAQGPDTEDAEDAQDQVEVLELADEAAVPEATDVVEPAGPVDTVSVESLRIETPVEEKLEPGTARLDAIEVTGSRIRRSDFEGAQPVLRVTRKDIERSGLTSIGDLLQDLPQAGAALNTAFNNGGDGSTEIDLRNLGSGRVLVLVNGRRWVNGLSQLRSNSVDLNTIPISIIESIEVLKDGASAVYGSDAIAGVVNIKTRRDFQGAELRAQVQGYEDGGGLTQSFSYAVGAANDKSSSFIDVSYVKQNELLAGDRDMTAIPTFGTGLSRGSGFTPFGRFLFVPLPTNGAAINGGLAGGQSSPCRDLTSDVVNGQIGGDPALPPLPIAAGVSLCDLTRRSADGRYVRFDQNTDSFNFAPVNYLLTPQERIGLFGQLSHNFDSGIRFSSEVLYNLRQSAQRLAQTPLGVGDLLPAPFNLAYVDSTNPFNFTNPRSPYYIAGTTPQDIGNSTGGQGLTEAGAILRRMVELGPRQFEQDVDTLRIGGGFDGMFDLLSMPITWEAGAAYAESKLATTEAGLVDMSRVARALGPIDQCVDTTLPDGTVVPRPAAAAGCVPLDLFGGPGTITADMLGYIAYVGHDTARQQQRYFYINGSTQIPGTDAFLPGLIGVAAGVEVRRENFRSNPDPLKVNGTSSTNASSATSGGYEAREAFVELAVPVLSDLFLAQSLNLSLAARYSDFDELGDNLSSKFGLEYRPVNDLMLRATYSEAFRAPSVTELYLGAVTSFPEVQDPCAGSEVDSGSDDFNANTAANCTADGASGEQLNAQLPTVFGGNADLNPETARSLTAGFVFSPSFLSDFDITVDWYRIRLRDFISFVGTDAIFDLCYRADPDSRALCDKVQRGPDGSITRIDNTATNFAKAEVEGVDVNLRWVLPGAFLNNLGRFTVTMDGAYVTAFNNTVPTAEGERTEGLVGQEFSGAGAIPRFKANAALIYSRGGLEASWTTRYVHSVIEPCDDGRQDPGAAAGGANPTPVLSFREYGLCTGERPRFGPIHKLDAVFYHDVQASYEVEAYQTKFVIGVLNLFDTDPPAAYSSLTNSFDASLHELPGSRGFYVRSITNF
ncbi:MAG TPA: TonB-dependent receptor [Solimonas sp.]